ncbi:MAG: radical SAM family heme chaperone HemW [Mycobacteriales bacterium]
MSPALPEGDAAPAGGALPEHVQAVLGRAPFGVYVHVPFCATRCGYCDFNTYTAAELPGMSTSDYLDSALAELRLAQRVLSGRMPPVQTIFVGGGTPSLLPADYLTAVVMEIRDEFGLAPDAEVTTEANPESVTQAYLERLREAGFTRVSLGMQSAVAPVLATPDRQNTPGRAAEAVTEAKRAGFGHVNLDLIYGTPGESDDDWRDSVEAAVAAGPDHISAYALVVEDGTALARRVARGELDAPDDDVLADRYVIADDLLANAGYRWYEVSNWARNPGAQCRHNLLYWTSGDWWGIGPGAHSHIGGVRWWNVKHPRAYAGRLDAGASPAAAREVLTEEQRRVERVLLRIRLGEGLPLQEIPASRRPEADRMLTYGLLQRTAYDEGRAVLTQRGRLLADAVVRDLVE